MAARNKEKQTRAASREAAEPDISTKQRIFFAAQKHFAEHGLQHASVRAITEMAQANSAAVVYYFGSKEQLFEDVLNQCVAALVEPRLQALDALEQQAGAKPPALEAVLRVLAEPYVINRADMHRPAALYARFYGRMYAEPNDVHRRVVRAGFEKLQKRFLAVLARRLDYLPLEELTWRFALVLTSLVHVAADTGSANRINPAAGKLSDEQLMQVLLGSFTGMLASPSALG